MPRRTMAGYRSMVKLDNITTGCSDLFISDRGFLLLDFLTTTPAETHSARRACK